MNRALLLPSLGTVVLCCAPATAQTSGESGLELQEVVVSATKRDEAITDVPVAVQVYGQEMLEQFGIEDFEDYAQYTPGLSFTKRGGGQSHVVVRGLSTGNVGNAQPQNRALVGIYLDDVPMQLNGFNFDPDLFDMQRVEVLKGPQGTLFGDSAMAGAIRYVTTPPNLQTVSGRVSLSGSGTHDGSENYAFRGMVNAPVIADTLGIRAVGWARKDGGWIDNLRTGEKNINSEETIGGRVSARFQPSDAFWIQGMVLAQKVDMDGRPDSDTRFPIFSQDRDPESLKDEALMLNLTANWSLSKVTITSVTGYLDRDFLNVNTEGMERNVIMVLGAPLPGTDIVDPWKQEYITEELRVSSAGENRLDYTAGLFVSRSKINYPTYAKAIGWDQGLVDAGFFGSLEEVQSLGCDPVTLPDHAFCGYLNTTQKQGSVFGELTWHITDKLDLIGGARYFDWEQEFDENYGGFFNGGPTQKTQTIKENGVNPRGGLAYHFNEKDLFFVNAGKGFRLGGVNDPLPPFCDQDVADAGLTEVDSFDSDSLWSYEAGVKLLLADRRVSVNASVFFVDWDNVQTTRQLENCGYAIIQNAGKVESQGFEIDSMFALTESLTLALAGSYTDAQLAEDSLNLGAVDGDRVPFVPRWKASAFVSYERPVSETWKGFMDFGIRTQEESFTEFSPTNGSRIRIPSSTIGSLRVGGQSERYRVALFADNLFDERAVNNAGRVGGAAGYSLLTYTQPRTVGLELTVEF